MRELYVCKVGDLAEGGVRIVGEPGKEIGVMLHQGAFLAYLNRCPHQGGPACEGLRKHQVVDVIDADGLYLGQRYDESDLHIVCPWHGYEFHISTGEHVADPKLKLRKFETVVRDGDVYVQL
jgi:nitrite reductase (NADH) small subunit